MEDHELVDERALSRRKLLERGVAAGVGLAAAPAASGYAAREAQAAEEKSVTLTFVSFGGAYQDAQTKGWVEPFMKANPNIKIVQDQPTDYAKIKAQAEAGNVTWDVVDVGNDFGLARNKDILTPLDKKVLKTAYTQALPGVIQSRWRVADIIYGVVMAYRTDKFKRPPAGWKDFFDTKTFPGKRGLWKFVSGGLLEFALVADGVPQKKLYPLDLNRAFKKLDTIKSDIVWWDTAGRRASEDPVEPGVSDAGLPRHPQGRQAQGGGAEVRPVRDLVRTQRRGLVLDRVRAAVQVRRLARRPEEEEGLADHLPEAGHVLQRQVVGQELRGG